MSDLGFWSDYDIPFEFGVAQNSRIGQLRRGSSGTGRGKSTVIHLYVLESFEEGRLSRDPGSGGIFLCKGEGRYIQRQDDGEEHPEKVTCSQCLSLMERWKNSEGGENQ